MKPTRQVKLGDCGATTTKTAAQNQEKELLYLVVKASLCSFD